MLHHRTTDIGKRAEHIAEHEANKAYHQTGNPSLFFSVFHQEYEEALVELQPP